MKRRPKPATRPTLVRPALLFGAALAAPAPGLPAQDATEALAITGVSVVDTEAGAVLENRTVVIEAGRIASIARGAAPPSGATVIDGRGRFLAPGLIDVHVHVRHAAAPEVLLPQFIANGVTGVRDMASGCDGEPEEGDVCLAELREWRERIEAGDLVGPRLLALSSPPLNPPWDYEVTEERARAVVRRFAERGADVIKTYFRLSPEAFGWIADEAGRQGLDVGGHIPLRMTAAEASDAGLRSLEHARDFLFDCFPGSAEFRGAATSQNPPVETMRSMVDDHDEEMCAREFETLVRNDTWYVPTHVTRRMDAYADDPDFRADPRRVYIPAFAWEEWQEDADRMIALDPSPEGRRIMRGFYERGLEITGRAHRAGVGIVLGTDAGDTYVFPGSGAHDELGELVRGGLSPAEALAAATIRAAEFLRVEPELGTVEPGKRADLLLLGANPLDDIANTRAIEMVIFDGRPHDRAALDAMLADVEEAVAALADR